MNTSGINEKAIQNIFSKFEKINPKWIEIIDKSFLSKKMKDHYKELIELKNENIYSEVKS